MSVRAKSAPTNNRESWAAAAAPYDRQSPKLRFAVVGFENAIDELEVTSFREQNRQQRGRVERHTPPGP